MFHPFIWAHRGASCCGPENTLAAFTAAVEGGADGLELDIHLSRDGIPIVIHDETLERTTDGYGPVAGMTLQQLQCLDAGSWFSAEFCGEPIPVLEDVLKTFAGRLRLNLELKEFRAGMVVLELLDQYPYADVVISSFNYDVLQRLRSVDRSLPLAVLFEFGLWRHAVQSAKELSAIAFHPVANQVNRPMIAACLQADLPVSVWTVDDACVARSLIRAGVSGLFTNDPSTLKAAYKRFKGAARR
jgi:glycerophosphoryl diester phosphodiesterase